MNTHEACKKLQVWGILSQVPKPIRKKKTLKKTKKRQKHTRSWSHTPQVFRHAP